MDKMLYDNFKKDLESLKTKVDKINDWVRQHDFMDNVYKYNKYYIWCDLVTEEPITCIYKEGDWVIRIVDKDEPNHHIGRIFKVLKVEGSLIHETNGITHWSSNVRLASHDEIENHLIEGAIKKGLLGWSKFNWEHDTEVTTIIAGYGYEYDANLDALLVAVKEKTLKRAVYFRGKWANLIFKEKKKLPRTKDEFNLFLGHWNSRHTKTTKEFLDGYED